MNSYKRLGIAAMMVSVAAGSYVLGQRDTPIGIPSAPKAAPAPATSATLIVPVLTTKPMNVAMEIGNPTGVLLGEVQVPDDLLRGPTPPPMTGVIVPEIRK